MDEKERVVFLVNTFEIIGVRLFISFIITEPVRQDASWPALRPKDILQSFSMKVSRHEEFMYHTVKKVGSDKE